MAEMQGSQLGFHQSIRRCLYLWFSVTYLILNWGPMGVIGLLENGYQSFTPLPSYKYQAISSSENENDDFLSRKGNHNNPLQAFNLNIDYITHPYIYKCMTWS